MSTHTEVKPGQVWQEKGLMLSVRKGVVEKVVEKVEGLKVHLRIHGAVAGDGLRKTTVLKLSTLRSKWRLVKGDKP